MSSVHMNRLQSVLIITTYLHGTVRVETDLRCKRIVVDATSLAFAPEASAHIIAVSIVAALKRSAARAR